MRFGGLFDNASRSDGSIVIIGTFSKGIHRLRFLEVFLDAEGSCFNPAAGALDAKDLVVGWGLKANTARARSFSSSNGIPYATLEDGFVRSLGLGREGAVSISLVVDFEGIYFDARRPSTLETILNGGEGTFTARVLQEAEDAISYILTNRISKYNGAPAFQVVDGDEERKKVLVVDQVKNDASVIYGMEQTFDLELLVEMALAENPGSDVYLKLHPETIAGFRKGGSSGVTIPRSVKIITEDVNSISLLEQMDKVYVATSLMGFEALMLGREVVCIGMPFYAGWGVTDDRMVCKRRIRKRGVVEIFAAAYILYSRYVNPHTSERCNIMTALKVLKTQIDHNERRRRNIYCFGIRHWKRYNILPFLKSRGNRVAFVKSVEEAKKKGIGKGDEVVVWGARTPEGLSELVALVETPLLRMEDGFLRSVGLGSDFIRPSSLVLDSKGIYFDPNVPSELENILNDAEFSLSQREVARRIQKKIVSMRLSKYNCERGRSLSVGAGKGQKILFIPGQVADDASISKGCLDIADNASLIRAVREENPGSYIIFKPHPDVSSGNRKGKVGEEILSEYCDQVVVNASIPDCLDVADEVYTMTSLVGFEALLRGVPVHVYGRPFYAGWGLTNDRYAILRRTRQLSLDELIAGALLVYPEYYDWESGFFTGCEQMIDKLNEQKKSSEGAKGLKRLEPSYLERQVRKMILIIKGISYVH
jgi:capsular polysaccharide export protein